MGLKWFSFAAMVVVILAQVSSMVAVKAALSQGMDKYVIMVYSTTICALIFLFPCSIITYRSASSRPPVTFNILCGFILVAVLGLMCGFAGIQYSSPTLGTALLNIFPAFTFILAIISRMEKIHWRSSSSQAKVVGTIVSITGAFVVTLYKGPPMMKTHIPNSYQLVSQQSNWILGGFLLAAEALTISVSYIVKALVLEKYPALLLMLFYTFSFGTVLSTISCLIIVKDSSAWRLRLDMGLFAILCSALSALVYLSLILWCLWKTGPLYVSMFKPLAILFAAVMSVVFLGDVLCLGSLIGSIIIVVGFYVVMWGKAKDKEISTEMENGVESSVSSSNKLPLLHNKIEDM